MIDWYGWKQLKVDGCSHTLNPYFLQEARRLISSIVLAPSSMVHHDFEVSCLCSAGHLHHTHEKVALAACVPTHIAGYFISAHMKKLMLKFCPSIVRDFMDYISLVISFTAFDKYLYFSCEFSSAIMWFPPGELGFSLPSKIVNAMTSMCMLRLTCVPSTVILTLIHVLSLILGFF